MDNKDYYQSILTKLSPQSKYVGPYDTSEAPIQPNMSVAPPNALPTVASHMPPPDPVEQAASGVVAPAHGSRTYGAGPANPASPVYVPPPAINPVTVLRDQKKQMGVLEDQRNRHVADATDAMTDVAIGQQAGAEQQSEIQGDLGDNLAASGAKDQHSQQMFHEDVGKLNKERQSITDEMSDFYQRQPTDLWGRAGVNKVSGIIGLFMGALSRDGHNPAMDALNTLVDQNLSQQKFNYQMLGDKVKMNDSLYARLRDKLGDDRAAELSARQVYLQEAQARLKAAESNTQSKTAKANLAAGIADLQLRQDALKEQSLNNAFDQVTKAANLGLTERGQTLTHAEHVESIGASREGKEAPPGEINGMTAPENAGLRLSKKQTDDVRAQQQGVAKIKLTVDKIRQTLQRDDWSDDVLKSRLEGSLKVAIIEADGLSKRVGGSEGELINQKAGNLALGVKGFFAKKISRAGLMKMFSDLHQESENAFTGGLVANGYTVTKGGMYDHASSASTDGQSDDEIIANIGTRGAMTPAQRQSATIPQYQGQG
jgi:hypothetical protein